MGPCWFRLVQVGSSRFMLVDVGFRLVQVVHAGSVSSGWCTWVSWQENEKKHTLQLSETRQQNQNHQTTIPHPTSNFATEVSKKCVLKATDNSF